MKTTSSDVLEFDALKELLQRYVSSPFGRAALDAIEPHSGRERLNDDLDDAAEAMEYLRAASQPKTGGRGGALRLNFGELPELTPAVQKLRIEGAVLEPKEVYQLLSLLDRAADMRSILLAVAERFPRLAVRGRAMGEFRNILNDLAGKVLPDGTVADHASVALARIRREIERQKKAIQESLERFLRAHQDEGILQEEFVTIRNERFVVPVISGQRKRIDGVIHGASSSGHTLFVEPMATIELNNDLVRLTEEEMRESHRVIREMTDRLRGYAESIRATLDAITELELIFGKARFGVEFDCVRPRFSPDDAPRFFLRDARHPLLQDVLKRQGKKVVPATMELDRERRTLLISGPNTGGKTVTLKTAGLLTLMAHAGLPVPCTDAELPVFEQVLADIGDNQSIQANLSTFSAHISHIREMVLDGTAESLVLLDELGAATDPEEGGALGVAVVDHFTRIGAFTLASTHLMALKLYGANTERVVNASMGFDEQTLEPTYHLHVGVPGKSAGLEIATRLGMPPYIMQRARQSMSTREQDLARFLSELRRKLDEVASLQSDLAKREAALTAREASLAKEWEKRESAKMREMEQRLEKVLSRFESDADKTLEQIRQSAEQRKAAGEGARRVSKARRELREAFETEVIATTAGVPVEKPVIAEGARVRLKGIREPARVKRLMGTDRLEVEAGFLKMQVDVDDVLEVLPGDGGPKLPKNVRYQPAPEFSPRHQEINVIGKHAVEACDLVEKFLDDAVMATAARVRIVHGHGMGILRRAIWKLLGESPHVEKYYQAPQNEGGAGATIVEIKE